MPAFYTEIPEDLKSWALAQPLFFTASAPLAGRHINISPKGLTTSCLAIFSPNEVAYIDATGSAAETISHVYENGRVTLMFSSFESRPRILRLFCTGRVVEWDQPPFERLVRQMDGNVAGARAVILLHVWKVQTSCGYGVPRMSNSSSSSSGGGGSGNGGGDVKALLMDQGRDGRNVEISKLYSPKQDDGAAFYDRSTLGSWAQGKVNANEMREYQAKWNSRSLDGCPGLKTARRDRERWLFVGDMKARALRLKAQTDGILVGFVLGILVMLCKRLIQVPAAM